MNGDAEVVPRMQDIVSPILAPLPSPNNWKRKIARLRDKRNERNDCFAFKGIFFPNTAAEVQRLWFGFHLC